MGLFSYKSFYKPGPGVEKDTPEKTAFFRFFELFGRKFWRYVEVNLIYFLVLLPVLMLIYATFYDNAFNLLESAGVSSEDITRSFWTPLLYVTIFYYQYVPAVIRNILVVASMLAFGPMKAGVTYVLRNFSQQSHSWLSDIWDKAKECWKQALLVGILDWVVLLVLVFNMTYQIADIPDNYIRLIRYISVLVAILYSFMRKYLYMMMVTVNLNLKSLFQNAWLLVFIGIFRNVGSGLVNLLLWIATYALILFVHSMFEAPILPCLIFSFTNFLSVFACYPMVSEYIVKPVEALQKQQGSDNNSDEIEY